MASASVITTTMATTIHTTASLGTPPRSPQSSGPDAAPATLEEDEDQENILPVSSSSLPGNASGTVTPEPIPEESKQQNLEARLAYLEERLQLALQGDIGPVPRQRQQTFPQPIPGAIRHPTQTPKASQRRPPPPPGMQPYTAPYTAPYTVPYTAPPNIEINDPYISQYPGRYPHRPISPVDRSRSPSPAPSHQSDVSGTDDASYVASLASNNWRGHKPVKIRTAKFNALEPKINRMPCDRWLLWQKKDIKTSVLDVATEQCEKRINGVDVTRTIPVRLGINSKYLQLEMAHLTNQSINRWHYVILPPWKAFIVYQTEIRARLVEIEEWAATYLVEHEKAAEGTGDEKDPTKQAGTTDAVEKTPLSTDETSVAEVKAISPEEAKLVSDSVATPAAEAEVKESSPEEAKAVSDPVTAPVTDTEVKETEIEEVKPVVDEDAPPPPPTIRIPSFLTELYFKHNLQLGNCAICGGYHNPGKKCIQTAINHFKALVAFLDEDLKETLEVRQELQTSKPDEVAFDDLWHLFSPGDIIIAGRRQKAYRVFHTSAGRPFVGKSRGYRKQPAVTSFRLDCFLIDFDREHVGPVHFWHWIHHYTGVKKIKSLEWYPIRYADNEAALKDKLIARGKRFREIAPFSHKRYQGLSAVDDPEQLKSDIIIDFEHTDKGIDTQFSEIPRDLREIAENCNHMKSNYESHKAPPPMASCDHCWNVVDDNVVDFDRASRIKQDLHLLQVQDTTDATLTDDHYMLLPDSVDAFVLRERDIFAVYIENIEDLDGDKTGDQEILKKQSGFGELVLPEGHGELVEALVKSHPSTRRPRGGSGNKLQIDLTKGKGEGLIILLHGVPGVGKTSTAECVAAYTGRPLYPITCANIGLDPEEVEKNLTGPGGHFRRAQQWNCVVLLDEADVFLAKRESGDTDSNRNALVSVFLRIVEFYQGILILTTNRVGSFDEAFVSRVQLFLYYPPLSHDQTLKVWQVNINRTRESGVVILDEDDEEAIITFAKEELSQGRTWNGRQIRNYFQTAISLSEYDVSSRHLRDVRNGTKPADSKPSKPRLSDKNIKKIAKATGKFIDYINTVLPEKSHEKQSRDEGMRNDAFGMTPRKSKRPE